jgi:hypothetical protein
MKAAGFRPRDLARYAQPMRQEIQDAAVTLAREHGLEIERVTHNARPDGYARVIARSQSATASA